MKPDFHLPVRLALGAALVATGAAVGSLATWSLVPARACTSCPDMHVIAPVKSANAASCAADSSEDETELVQLAQLTRRDVASPARAHGGVHLTRWQATRQQ